MRWLLPEGFRDSFRGLGAVVYKEVIHLKRDSAALLFAVMIPIIQLATLGFAIDTNVRQVKTVVYDGDNTEESRRLVDRLRNSDTFRVVRYVYSDDELNDYIVGGKARVGVKIPVDYSRQLLRRDNAQVLVLIDGSDNSVAGQVMNVSAAIGLDESLRRVVPEFQAGQMPIEMRPKMLFNPDSRSPNFFLPGLIAVLLLSVTTFLTAFSIVREKERGTLEQLFVTPVRPMGLLLGKITPYLAIGFAVLCMMLLAIRFIFQVPINGATMLLLALSIPYLFVSLSFGTLISTRANSQAEAMQTAFLIFIPSIFFSGYIFPRETMPLPFYILSYFIPASYFVNITRGIILRGAELRHLWVDGLVLVLMGLGLLLIAAKRFQKKLIAT
jgi:ABC-2 type transport system permease protein